MSRAATTSDSFNAVAEPRRRDILDFLAPAEAGSDVQVQADVAGRQRLGGLHAGEDGGIEAAALADEAQPRAQPVQFVHLALQRAEEQLHQPAHFLGGPVPVLAGKGEQGQRTDAAVQAELHAALDRARTEAEIQKITDSAIKDVDDVVKAKEAELMSV